MLIPRFWNSSITRWEVTARYLFSSSKFPLNTDNTYLAKRIWEQGELGKGVLETDTPLKLSSDDPSLRLKGLCCLFCSWGSNPGPWVQRLYTLPVTHAGLSPVHIFGERMRRSEGVTQTIGHLPSGREALGSVRKICIFGKQCFLKTFGEFTSFWLHIKVYPSSGGRSPYEKFSFKHSRSRERFVEHLYFLSHIAKKKKS